jgi:toxin ParE1/3/4
MAYYLKIKPWVYDDIQKGIDWYNAAQNGLGEKFHKAIKKGFKTLTINPFFQIRYDNVRCFPLKKFPYMIHYVVEEDKRWIVVLAVINTNRDPAIWRKMVKRE